MTNAEYIILKTNLQAVKTVEIAYENENPKTIKHHLGETRLQFIADWYNTKASGVPIWKPNAPVNKIIESIIISDYLLLSSAKRDALLMWQGLGTIDATVEAVRTGLADILSGASLTAALATIERQATRFEALFVTDKASSMFGYEVSGDEILKAWRLKNL